MHIAVRNEGVLDDTYDLSYSSDLPFDVIFKDNKGRRIDSVKAPGKTRNLLYSRPIEITAEAEPEGDLPLNTPQEITLVVGPGKYTKNTGELKVQVVEAGALFCMNDLAGMRPHPHQVMPGETTSFIFHATNLQDTERVLTLGFPKTEDGWRMQQVGSLKARAKPGETVQFEVRSHRTEGGGSRRAPGIHRDAQKRVRQEACHVDRGGRGDRRPQHLLLVCRLHGPAVPGARPRGTGQGREGDWLMPNTRASSQDGTNYSDARCYLPSATDMNHTNALAGTYTGTQGIYMVGGTFKGFTEHDEVLLRPTT